MNLRQLEVFYAIMQAGTVSGAARLLHVSQPNVTRVLAHTEQQLSFALFERVKGRLVPTQEAKALLPEAEKVYQQLGQFRSLTNKVKQDVTERLNGSGKHADAAIDATSLMNRYGVMHPVDSRNAI